MGLGPGCTYLCSLPPKELCKYELVPNLSRNLNFFGAQPVNIISDPSWNGAICPSVCPIQCKEGEVRCYGSRDENGCDGQDTCLPSGNVSMASFKRGRDEFVREVQERFS